MDKLNFQDKLQDVAIAQAPAGQELSLDQVGLESVQTRVLCKSAHLPAVASGFVSLEADKSRGIHMSRLFKIMQELDRDELTFLHLTKAVDEMLTTHDQLSTRAELEVEFELPLLREALLSGQKGWRHYPMQMRVSRSEMGFSYELMVKVLYSSTCPCSAALSQQALRDAFLKDFTEDKIDRSQLAHWLASPESLVATAHAQRSEAICRFQFADPLSATEPEAWIDLMEKALGTPVQTAVKRADEQEFARLNAKNLMFCEDAARKLKAALMTRAELADFQIEVRHFESLHAHDVVARASKLS
ncbi:MAG: GTP cyclohydrolase FolE2 [Bdellovibrionales bacterium]